MATRTGNCRKGRTASTVMSLVAMLALPAAAQEGNRSQHSVGAGLAPTLKLKELTSEWRYVGIQPVGPTASDSSEMLKQLMQLGMMAQAGEKGKAPGADAALGMMVMSSMFGGGTGSAKPIHYTRGQTVAIGPETFLVTYRFQPHQGSLMELALKGGAGNQEPDLNMVLGGGKLTEESVLSLALLNVRSIGALTDFRPFDLKREMELQAKAGGGGLMDLFGMAAKEGLGGAAGNEGAGPEAGAVATPEDPAAVARAVRKALAEDAALKKAPNRITVTVEEGEVRLSGTATSRFMHQRAALIAEQAVEQLPGFYVVENQLTIRAPKGRR